MSQMSCASRSKERARTLGSSSARTRLASSRCLPTTLASSAVAMAARRRATSLSLMACLNLSRALSRALSSFRHVFASSRSPSSAPAAVAALIAASSSPVAGWLSNSTASRPRARRRSSSSSSSGFVWTVTWHAASSWAMTASIMPADTSLLSPLLAFAFAAFFFLAFAGLEISATSGVPSVSATAAGAFAFFFFVLTSTLEAAVLTVATLPTPSASVSARASATAVEDDGGGVSKSETVAGGCGASLGEMSGDSSMGSSSSSLPQPEESICPRPPAERNMSMIACWAKFTA
mmetsp:Transcript_118850/g.296416  ORF Transcript_118850/g.296416 Transcript_118850/m.296416 type:complete len:292 (-) Transcript_118850:1410-2285(-)